MFDFMGMANDYEERKVDKWVSEDNLKMVSTCYVTDGREPYETAFEHPDYNDGKIVIVECYSTEKDAAIGHDKWLKIMLGNNLPYTLTDCANSEVSQTLSECGGQMTFERKDI